MAVRTGHTTVFHVSESLDVEAKPTVFMRMINSNREIKKLVLEFMKETNNKFDTSEIDELVRCLKHDDYAIWNSAAMWGHTYVFELTEIDG